MTDNEIIKAFECCNSDDVSSWNDCPLLLNNADLENCEKRVRREALNLINRQKARIEELQEKSVLDDKLLNDRVQEAVNSVSKANQKYVDALEKAFNDKVAELKVAKTEAIKDFAERLCMDRVSNDPVVIAVKTQLKNDGGRENGNR